MLTSFSRFEKKTVCALARQGYMIVVLFNVYLFWYYLATIKWDTETYKGHNYRMKLGSEVANNLIINLWSFENSLPNFQGVDKTLLDSCRKTSPTQIHLGISETWTHEEYIIWFSKHLLHINNGTHTTGLKNHTNVAC